MHGLINRTIQVYVTHTHGREAWEFVAREAGLGFTDFEGMMRYSETYTPRLLTAMVTVLERRRTDLMEDLGTFVVSHESFTAVRRLLRFGGMDFVEFLHSLDDLDERVRLAVPGLDLPKVELHALAEGSFSLYCDAEVPGYGHVMIGLLRAMADDYGALALLDHAGQAEGREIVAIQLVETDFAEGRHFELGARAG